VPEEASSAQVRSVSWLGWLVGGLTLLVGAGAIATGWLLDGHAYASSLLQNAGVALLLLVPLFAAERAFTRRVRSTEQATKEVRRDVAVAETRIDAATATLEEIARELETELDATAVTDAELTKAARSGNSVETLGSLFHRAAELGALSEHGLRVVVPHQWERFRFRWSEMPGPPEVEPGSILVSVEGVRGDSLGIAVEWTPGMTAAEALSGLVDIWTRAGSFPGQGVLEVDRIFPPLIDSLELAINERRGGGENSLSPLIERVSQEWAMTDFGLEHIGYPYWIRGEELASDVEDWRRHMWEKNWILEEDERAKQAHEPDFWMLSEVASKFFEYLATKTEP
jgi:hypothetical protein